MATVENSWIMEKSAEPAGLEQLYHSFHTALPSVGHLPQERQLSHRHLKIPTAYGKPSSVSHPLLSSGTHISSIIGSFQT